MRRSIIVAMDQDGLIGVDGRLPWGRSLRSELRRFRELTLGKPVILGRKTHESIGPPLAGRVNLVLSRDANYRADGCVVVRSLEEALAAAQDARCEEVMIAGGREVYADALTKELCDRIYLSTVAHRFASEGERVTFPRDWPGEWRRGEPEHHPADAQNAYAWDFRVVDRVRQTRSNSVAIP